MQRNPPKEGSINRRVSGDHACLFFMENESFSLRTRLCLFFFVAGKSTSPMYLVKKFKFTFVGFTRSYKCLAEFQPGVVWMAVTIATACTVLYIVLGISNLLRLFLFKHCKISQFLHHHTPIYLCCRRHNLNIWLLSLGFLPFL